MLGAQEAERLSALEATERDREFLRSWVRHEAAVKCLGIGLGSSPRAGDSEHVAPWVAELDIGDIGAAAVAASWRPRELRCWEWPGR